MQVMPSFTDRSKTDTKRRKEARTYLFASKGVGGRGSTRGSGDGRGVSGWGSKSRHQKRRQSGEVFLHVERYTVSGVRLARRTGWIGLL